jgi:hypothetical protein
MEELKLFLLSVGPASLLMFIPYMIYTDIKHRRVSHELFYFLASVNFVPLFMIYWFHILPPINLVYSIIISVGVFAIWKKFGSGAFSAADRNLIVAIAFLLFWVPWREITPTTYQSDVAAMYLFGFIAYFMMVCMFIPGVLFAYNYIAGRRSNILQMLTYYPRGIPFIVPIAVAFYLAVMFG